MEWVKQQWQRFQQTRIWRAWERYGQARGNLLAGGVTYFSFFSIFPAIALAFTIFGIVLRGNEQLFEEIVSYVDNLLPGFVDDGDGEGLLSLTVPSDAALSLTGLIAVAGLIWAGLGWLGALRDGIRAIAGAPADAGNTLVLKARDLGSLVFLGLAVALSGVVTGFAGTAAGTVGGWVGLGGGGVVKVASVLVGVVLDTLILWVMLGLLSGLKVPWRLWRQGALLGGVGLTLLKLAGTSALGAMNNPLFASIALVVGLLVWLNFIARIVLIAAAWGANDIEAAGHLPAPNVVSGGTEQTEVGADAPGSAATKPAGAVTAVVREAVPLAEDQRAQDRLNLALGAAAGAGVSAVAAVIVAARRAVRRR